MWWHNNNVRQPSHLERKAWFNRTYPTREYFRLLMGSLASNNSLFSGADYLYSITREEWIFFVGKCIALSLLYGGPGPHFFCETTADYLLGLPFSTSPSIASDVPDHEVSENIKQVKDWNKSPTFLYFLYFDSRVLWYWNVVSSTRFPRISFPFWMWVSSCLIISHNQWSRCPC